MGISPERVRQLIAAGAMPAVRVGGRWVIDDGDVTRRAEGRPWSEAAAWALLWSALGRSAPWLSVKQRQRTGQRLAVGVRSHVERLSSRAQPEWFRAHPSALGRLVRDARLVAGGLSAARAVDADVVAAEHADGYVRASDVAGLLAEYGLERSTALRGNVVLRVLADVWPFNPDERAAPALVLALDLLESADDRTSRAGRSLLESALGPR
jgi:hypothetical protein